MKICSVGTELFFADGQTDQPEMTKLLAAVCNFENAPDNIFKCQAASFDLFYVRRKRPWNPQNRNLGGHQEKFGLFGEGNNLLGMPGTAAAFLGRSARSLNGLRHASPSKRRWHELSESNASPEIVQKCALKAVIIYESLENEEWKLQIGSCSRHKHHTMTESPSL